MEQAELRVLVDVFLRMVPFVRIVRGQDEFQELLQAEDPSMMKLINSSLQETPSCQEVESLNLPVGTQIVTFRHYASVLSPEQI